MNMFNVMILIVFLRHEDGSEHQHRGQVHTKGCLKEIRLKYGGGKGDDDQEHGGKVGGEQFRGRSPFEENEHLDSILRVTGIPQD